MNKHNATGRNKGRLPPFVPATKEVMNTEAWRALSHGARSLYLALKGHYNTKLQNAVYLSTRKASEELGAFSSRACIMKWFRELEHYGFIRMVSAGSLGLHGCGKASHNRLTEVPYQGRPPTRDYLNWNGEPFRMQKSPSHYRNRGPKPWEKIQNPGYPVYTTPVHTGQPYSQEPKPPEVVHTGYPYGADKPGTHEVAITSLTTTRRAGGPSGGH